MQILIIGQDEDNVWLLASGAKSVLDVPSAEAAC